MFQMFGGKIKPTFRLVHVSVQLIFTTKLKCYNWAISSHKLVILTFLELLKYYLYLKFHLKLLRCLKFGHVVKEEENVSGTIFKGG